MALLSHLLRERGRPHRTTVSNEEWELCNNAPEGTRTTETAACRGHSEGGKERDQARVILHAPPPSDASDAKANAGTEVIWLVCTDSSVYSNLDLYFSLQNLENGMRPKGTEKRTDESLGSVLSQAFRTLDDDHGGYSMPVTVDMRRRVES